MKNNLFRNFTALLLSGTMLAGVGCKDYDDDIDNINKRLDAMEIELSSVPEQIEAIKGSIPDLTDLTSRVAALEGSSIDSEGLKTELEALQATLEKYVDDEIGKLPTVDAMTETLKQTFATLTALSDLETAITGENGAIDQAIANAITALKNDVKTWLGPTMSEYLTDYATKDYADQAASDAVSEVLNQIKTEQGDYYNALVGLIDSAITGPEGTIKISKEQLDTELKELIDKIEPLINRVAELEGRIQSLVYVPTRLDKKIMFEGASWIDFAGEKYYLGLKEQQSAVITFRVSPASVAEKIVKGFARESGYNNVELSIIPEKVTRAEEAEENFTIEKCELVEGKSGEFKVTATTGYKYGATADETLAIALNVKIAPAEGSESTQGIDYTTEFIGTDYTAGGEVNDNLVIAKAEEGGEYTEIEGVYDDGQGTLTTVTYNTKLPYYSTETVTFLKDFDVYYKDAEGNYSALSAMWNNTDLKTNVVAPDAKTGKPTASANAGSYNLDEATSFSIKTSSTNLIGNTVTSGEFLYQVKADDKTLDVAKVKQVVTIDTKNTAAVAENIAMNWQYAITSVSGDYTKENVTLSTKLTYEDYNTIKNITTKGTAGSLNANEYAVTVTKNGQAVADGSITEANITLTANPSADGDVQFITVTLKGTLKVGGDYVVVATYMKADNTTVTITANVTVTGMPTDITYAITADKTYDGSANYDVLSTYAKEIWDRNKDVLTPAFENQAAFETLLYGDDVTVANDKKGGKASLSADKTNKKITVAFDADAAYDTAYTPSLTISNTTTGFAVVFTSKVTLKNPNAALTPGSFLSLEEGKYVALINTSLTGSTFSVENKVLANAYNYNGDLQNATIVYSVDEDLSKFQGTKPEIDADGKLKWGDWSKFKMNLKAELTLGGRVLATEKFVARINDPVAATITYDNTKNKIYTQDATTELTIASILSLAAQQGNAIDPDANVFDVSGTNGLNSDLKTALGASDLEYKMDTNDVLKLENGKVSLVETSIELPSTKTFNVKVTYTYRFGTRSIEVPIEVIPGTAPVEP